MGDQKPNKESSHKAIHPTRHKSSRRMLSETERKAAENNAINIIKGPDPKFPVAKGLEQYENKDLVYLVETSASVANELYRWISEEMTEEVIHYYVYYPCPCRMRLATIEANMDSLLTVLRYNKPEVTKQVQSEYESLSSRALEEDKSYEMVSKGHTYWPERFNPVDVKRFAAKLRQTLMILYSMSYKELTGSNKSGSGSKRGRPQKTKSEIKKTYELANDWKRAKNLGIRKAGFCQDKKIDVTDLDAALKYCREHGI
ncbi:hypothetical protein ACFL6U_06985 [Planctomycetota bacterium]